MKRAGRRGSVSTALEAAGPADPGPGYVLRLFVTGNTRHSVTAILNIRRICEEYLSGDYDLKILDLLREPSLAAGELIVAAPTLVKKLPLPERRFIGDLSQTDRVLVGLGLPALAAAVSPAPAADAAPG